MARASKEHILSEMRRLAAENGGTPLSRDRFEAATDIGQSEWVGRYWARWNDAVRDAGLQPNAWQTKEHEDEALIRILADITRAHGRFPATPELRMWRHGHPEMPNDKVFNNRLGPKAEQLAVLLAFARSSPDYADVAAICEVAKPRPPRTKPVVDQPIVTGVVYLLRMGEFHKIGKSNDPGRRQYEIGLRLPEQHEIEHVIETDDPSGIEAYWHRRFASQRANGEWFRLAAMDRAAFKRRAYM